MKHVFRSVVCIGMMMLFSLVTLAQRSYEATIAQWYQQRTQSLKQLESPLSLEGMFWLQPGENTFGNNASSKFKLPVKGLPDGGSYMVTNDSVILQLPANSPIKILGQTSVAIKDIPKQDSLKYTSDKSKSIILAYDTYKWFVTYNAGRLAVRFLNGNSQFQQQFSKLDIYPVSKKYVYEGKYYPPVNNSILIKNVVGFTSQQSLAGYVEVTIDGRLYKLDALKRDDKLFVVFSDSTGLETSYPFKFLYLSAPVAGSNKVTVDFNYSTNPNCAFTPNAECPLPTENNIIQTYIYAGEKKYQPKSL